MSGDSIEHLRAVLGRYKTAVQADTQANTEQSDGLIPLHPTARQRGSPEHLRDLTYALDLLVGEVARARRAHSELTTQAELALREARSETLALATEVWWTRRAVPIVAVGLGGCYALASLALGLAGALWWRL